MSIYRIETTLITDILHQRQGSTMCDHFGTAWFFLISGGPFATNKLTTWAWA